MITDVTVARTRILFALMRVFDRDGRATVRTVSVEARRSKRVVQDALVRLADEGLVERGNGKLRPLVEIVGVAS